MHRTNSRHANEGLAHRTDLGYDRQTLLRFVVYAVPLLVLLQALFGFTVELLDFEPRSGSVIKLALFEQPRVPGQLILGTWLVEASGLIALFLLARGRFGFWWLDGLVAGWVGWIFRGPLLVITIVVAARQPQDAWWTLAFGWWVLYSVCGLSLAILARRSELEPWALSEPAAASMATARRERIGAGSEGADPEQVGPEAGEEAEPADSEEAAAAEAEQRSEDPTALTKLPEPVETRTVDEASEAEAEPVPTSDCPETEDPDGQDQGDKDQPDEDQPDEDQPDEDQPPKDQLDENRSGENPSKPTPENP